MVTTSDTKYDVGSSKFKNSSMSSISTVTSKTATVSNNNTTIIKKRLESMTDEEIVQNNLKELMDKKNREERKANGRLVAVILASLVIFLGIYHACNTYPSKLAGILVPAVIMLSFALWVVVLAKRDKAKREIFEKYLEETALKNKQELEAKAKLKKSHERKSSNDTLLHFENEINNEILPLTHIGHSKVMTATKPKTTTTSSVLKNKDHRKHRKHRNAANSDGYSTTSSSSSRKSSSHYATKDLRVKRPSIRQKLFRQTGIYHMPTMSVNATQSLVQAVINTPVPQYTPPLINVNVVAQGGRPTATLLETKRKRLQRLNALKVPTMVHMSSVP